MSASLHAPIPRSARCAARTFSARSSARVGLAAGVPPEEEEAEEVESAVAPLVAWAAGRLPQPQLAPLVAVKRRVRLGVLGQGQERARRAGAAGRAFDACQSTHLLSSCGVAQQP